MGKQEGEKANTHTLRTKNKQSPCVTLLYKSTVDATQPILKRKWMYCAKSTLHSAMWWQLHCRSRSAQPQTTPLHSPVTKLLSPALSGTDLSIQNKHTANEHTSRLLPVDSDNYSSVSIPTRVYCNCALQHERGVLGYTLKSASASGLWQLWLTCSVLHWHAVATRGRQSNIKKCGDLYWPAGVQSRYRLGGSLLARGVSSGMDAAW